MYLFYVASPHERAFYVHQAPLEEANVSNASHEDDSSITQLSEAQVADLVADVAKHALLRMNLVRRIVLQCVVFCFLFPEP